MKIFVKLLPLLILYSIIVLSFSKPKLQGDEGRYYRYAQNITEGYFTDSENPYLASGPGYPLYLSIFIGLGLPMIVAKLFNGLLIIFGLLYFYHLVNSYVSSKTALILTYILGLYFPMFSWLILNYTEPLTFLLVCSLMFYLFKLQSNKSWNIKNWIIPSLILTVLILTKLIFLYVTIASLTLFLVFYFLFKKGQYLKFATLLAVSLMFLAPFFIYTYSLTNKLFYTSTASGLGLYWMSSKLPNEYGSCLSTTYHTLYENPEINEVHKNFFKSIEPYSYAERNDILLNKAKENIKKNPKYYLVNIVNNISRLFFNFPFSYRNQTLKTHWYLIYNFILIIGFIISLYPAWVNKKSIPAEILMIGIFFLIYFGGSSLVIGLSRMFFPVIPFLLFWNSYIFSKYLKVGVLKVN